MENLLDNALRYTPAGGTMAVSWRQEHNLIFITVTDTAPGIALRELGAPVLDLLAHHHYTHVILLSFNSRAAGRSHRPQLVGHTYDTWRREVVTHG